MHPLFQPCLNYMPITVLSRRDCAECKRQYGERACPTFAERFRKRLMDEEGMEPHQRDLVLLLTPSLN